MGVVARTALAALIVWTGATATRASVVNTAGPVEEVSPTFPKLEGPAPLAPAIDEASLADAPPPAELQIPQATLSTLLVDTGSWKLTSGAAVFGATSAELSESTGPVIPLEAPSAVPARAQLSNPQQYGYTAEFVPEPGAASVLTAFAVGTLARRRRRV